MGYLANHMRKIDIVVDQAGVVFIEALSKEPQTLEEISEKIAKVFNISSGEIMADAADFYQLLHEKGYVSIYKDIAQLNENSIENYYQINRENKENRFAAELPGLSRNSDMPDSKKILAEYYREHPTLRSLQIEIITKCNERCVHCYIPHNQKTTELSFETFADAVAQAKTMGLTTLSITGGEPLLHKDFIHMLKLAKSYDLSVIVFSNLTLLNEELLCAFSEENITKIQVSLYSMNPEIHDAITLLKGSQVKTINAIKKLIENNIPVAINCPVMDVNENCAADVVKWGDDRNISVTSDCVLMGKFDHDTSNLQHRVNDERIERFVREAVSKDKVYLSEISRDRLKELSEKDISEESLCGVCTTTLSMTANGDIVPCSGWQGYVLGNIHDTSLSDIWDNSPKAKYLRGIRRKDFPKCLACEDKAFCALCMVRNANESPTGDPLELNPHFCDVARINREIVEEMLSTESISCAL
jgi:radical SAM protein with 4Fe4S-binding SPASM domain